MNDDKSIDLKTEYNKATNELVELRQKYSELEQDWKYIKSLLDAEFEKGIELKKENEQLKQRNNRQYEQLGRLYNLIEQKDWRALNDILDDFKKCEEQLQKEWGTYGDVE